MEHLPVRNRRLDSPQQVTIEPRSSSVPGGFFEFAAPDDGGDQWNRWLQYGSTLVRHKVAILAATVFGILLALAVSLFQTPVYVSGTTLEFETQSSQQQQFEGISFLNTFDPFLVQTQIQLLKSDILQSRVRDKLRQDRANVASGTQATAIQSVSASDPLGTVRASLGIAPITPEWEGAVAFARSRLTITPLKDSRIVQVTSESTVPEVTSAYLNTLVSEFIKQTLEDRWSLYQSTSTYLARAQQDLKSQLETSERQLLEYANTSGLVVTSKNENIVEQKLIQLQAEASKAQAERIAKESVYRTAMAQPAESLGMLDQGPMGQYQAKLADLRRELADASTSLTPEHPKVKRLQAQIEAVESSRSQETANILARMRSDYESAVHREKELVGDLTTQSDRLSSQDQKLIRYKMLQREVDTYRTLYETTLQKGKEASVASALRPASVRIVDAARTPKRPSKPNVLMNLGMGFLGGCGIGVAFVLFRDGTDASIRVPGSIPVILNLRELGVIPCGTAEPDLPALSMRKQLKAWPSTVSGSRQRSVSPAGVIERVELATWNRKSSILAESFRATLASILSSGNPSDNRHVILVTSPSPQEGKSTVITNLAIALAEIDQRVLLVDADLRRPRLHTILNQANTWGLSDLLRETAPCESYPPEALSRTTHIPRLSFLPSGPGSANVSRLLYSARMVDLLERFRNDFDAVLIDTPPVLRVADARILSRLVDAVVLVFRAGYTTRDTAAMAVNVFEADGAPVLGTVLNDWNPRTMGRGYYPADYFPYGEASNL